MCTECRELEVLTAWPFLHGEAGYQLPPHESLCLPALSRISACLLSHKSKILLRSLSDLYETHPALLLSASLLSAPVLYNDINTQCVS